ncbi:MAG: T9SS type A sorting domain-containing protein [Calditrichaeota bacterium]|nr:T9SS type A sorting domain-containing protein [Calditrichota bacterium]
MQKIMISIICSLIFIACLNNGLSAREWSEPIRLTSVYDNLLHHNFEVEIDSEGNLHLLYSISRHENQRDNFRSVYQKMDQEGNIIVGPLFFFPDSTSAYPDWKLMCLDDNDNVYIIIYNGRGSLDNRWHRFLVIDPNGEMIIQPRRLEGLRNAWYGYHVNPGYNTSDGRPRLVYNQRDSHLVYACLSRDRNEENEPVADRITYTRLTLEGEVIDSTFSVVTFDRMAICRAKSNLLEVDSQGNIYLQWGLWDGPNWYSQMISKYDRNNRVVFDQMDIRSIDGNVNWNVTNDFIVDSDENVYLNMLMLDENQESGIVTGLKLNSYLEIEWQRRICEVDPLFNFGQIALTNNSIALTHTTAPISFISYDFDGDVKDSLEIIDLNEYVAFEAMLRSWNNQLFYVFRGSNNRDRNDNTFDMFMVKDAPLSIITPHNNYPKITSFAYCYPNPFNNILNVVFNPSSLGIWRIVMFDVQGRFILEKECNIETIGGNTIQFDIGNTVGTSLPSGIYNLVLYSPEGVVKKNLTSIRLQ